MSLDLALVLRYSREGDTRMLDETSSGIKKVGETAKEAVAPVAQMAEGVKATGDAAPAAAEGVDRLGEAAQRAGGQFGDLKTLGITAVTGIAGAIATAGIDMLFGAALGAAVDYFDELTNSAANIEADLTAHQDLIAGIKGLWNEAKGAASSYGLTSAEGLRFEAQQNVARLGADLESELGRVRGREVLNMQGAFGASLEARAPFDDAIARLRKDLRDGKADVIAFREEVARIASALPLDDDGRSFAETVLGDTQQAAELQAELLRSVDLYRSLTGDAEAATTALGKNAQAIATTGTEAAAALPALRSYAELIASMGGVSVTLPDGTVQRGEPGSIGGSFAAGGFTGHLPTDRVAGFVHGQEFVFDAHATARIGVDNLEAIRRGVGGYATGGPVGLTSTTVDGRYDVIVGLVDDFRALRGAVKDFASELWDAKSPIEALAATVKSASQSYLNRALGAVGNVLEDLFMPSYAIGTSFHPGGWARINEEGGERVYLPRGSQVVPAGLSAAMSGSVTNIFNISTPSPRAFAESRSSVARTAARISGAAQRHV